MGLRQIEFHKGLINHKISKWAFKGFRKVPMQDQGIQESGWQYCRTIPIKALLSSLSLTKSSEPLIIVSGFF